MVSSSVHMILLLFLLGSVVGLQSKDNEDNLTPQESKDKKQEEEIIKEGQEEEENLPVLPPIILLDFGDNSTSTGPDGKSKRTVNDNLGYGFLRNSFQEGKTNYYFPAGKSGTTVTIEESVSPFLPRTIVERLEPMTTTTVRSNYLGDNYRVPTSMNNHNPHVKNPVFGQRTKLYKTVGENVGTNFYHVPPTSNDNNFNVPMSYQSYNPDSQENPSASDWNVRLHHRPFQTSHPDVYSEQQDQNDSQFYRNPQRLPSRPSGGFTEPQQVHENMPKYTVENGVRYENKIVWKYPDGRVSEVGPYGAMDYSSNRSTDARVNSQGPVKFPPTDAVYEEPTTSTPFISSDSLSSNLPQQQVYRLGYQNLVGPKNAANLVQLAKSMAFRQNPQIDSRYVMGNSNSNYGNVYASDTVPERTETLAKVQQLDAGDNSRPNAGHLKNYMNLQYADLLSYNPSISEYVRNPSSILNVYPTFIQTGKSLVPVIILRVDGAPPIHSKDVPNVNLKALLQQYLIQYAKSVQELARPSDYEFGNVDHNTGNQNHLQGGSRHLDLAHLIHKSEENTTPSYAHRTSYEESNNKRLELDRSKTKGIGRHVGRGKIKSVEIIEDPRFTSYRVKN